MKTRFDGTQWVSAFGVVMEVNEMETGHLLNTVKMLVQKPARTQAMLVDDIEKGTFADGAWSPVKKEDNRKQSLHNATSLSAADLITYVQGTVLFKAMLEELEARGINTQNILELYTKDDTFLR